MEHVLHVDETAEPKVTSDADRVVDDVVDGGALEALRRVDGVRVARVDARALDVLHDARNHDGVPVGYCVDLHLGALQVLVDQDLATGHRADRPYHVAAQLLAIAHYLHRPTAQHVAVPDEHRVASALGDGFGLLDRGGGAAHRLGDPDRINPPREPAPDLRPAD